MGTLSGIGPGCENQYFRDTNFPGHEHPFYYGIRDRTTPASFSRTVEISRKSVSSAGLKDNTALR
eukprot:1786847-Rhodomonas_salina.5